MSRLSPRQDGDTWLVNPSILLESYLPPERDWDADSTPYFIAAPDENGVSLVLAGDAAC
jgi:hypothetical protein